METIEEQDGPESGYLAEMRARKFALLGDEARSLEWFGEAIRRGNRSLTLLRAPELAPIRRLPEYGPLADEIRVVLRR
jgi:hypothetical protein